MSSNTVRLHRVLRATPERIYRAFLDGDAMAKWRKVHIPIFIVFAVLAIGHIVSIFLFWGWR